MKKVLYLIVGLAFLSMNARGQAVEVAAPLSMWTIPAIFEMDQPVTLYVDLSGGGFDEGEDIYWWVWQPSEPDKGNHANSSEFAKWEYDGNMMWKKSIIPTEYFGLSKEEMWNYEERKFWCRVKDQSGTRESGVFSFSYPEQSVADLVGSELWASDPADFNVLTQTSVYFNANQAAGFSPGEDIYLNAQINNPEGGDDYLFTYESEGAEKTKMLYLGDGIYRKDIDVKSYFFIPSEGNPEEGIVNADYELLYIKGTATNGSTTSDGFQLTPLSLDPGTPMVYLFPSAPLFENIFVINRVNPQPGEDPITYNITVRGFDSISGTLDRYPNTGADKNRSVYLYLPDYWESCPTEEIRIRLTGANGNRFFDQRIKINSLDSQE